jgi:hypothetical protein
MGIVYKAAALLEDYHDKNQALQKEVIIIKEALEANKVVPPDKAIVDWCMFKTKAYVPRAYVEQYVYKISKTKYYKMELAIIAEESRFDTYAISPDGSKGLAMIRMSVWADRLKSAGIIKEDRDIFDHEKNIKACEYILTIYKKEYGNWNKVLFNYVGGNSAYVTKVLANYAELSLIEKGE